MYCQSCKQCEVATVVPFLIQTGIEVYGGPQTVELTSQAVHAEDLSRKG